MRLRGPSGPHRPSTLEILSAMTSLLVFATLLACGSSPSTSVTVLHTHDRESTRQMTRDVQYLADDRREGRDSGSPGERDAARYIASRFERLGLEPAGSNGYLDPFSMEIADEVNNAGTTMTLGGRALRLGYDFVVASGSSAGFADALAVVFDPSDSHRRIGDDLGSASFRGAIAVVVRRPGSLDDGHEIWAAAQQGASGVVLLGPGQGDDQATDSHRRATRMGVPAVSLTGSLGDQYFEEPSRLNRMPIGVSVALRSRRVVAANVVGRLSGRAARSDGVVIGAHYDHLGTSQPESGRPAVVYNGADDNASGVAMMLELARHFSRAPPESESLWFVAFSGEERGLAGSQHFVNSALRRQLRFHAMINLDMVGRLRSARLFVDGMESSPAFSPAFRRAAAPEGLAIRSSLTSCQISDHLSFYLAAVPSVHVFTGTHQEYHTPVDDAEFVDQVGMGRVARVAGRAIRALSSVGRRLEFVGDATMEARAYCLSTADLLGVVPDRLYPGRGVRAFSVIRGSTVASAGMRPGDIIREVDGMSVDNELSYSYSAVRSMRQNGVVLIGVDRAGVRIHLMVRAQTQS